MKLTKREAEVLQLLCAGNNCKQVAHILSLHPRTPTTHASNIRKKTGCKTQAQLGVWAVRNGIV